MQLLSDRSFRVDIHGDEVDNGEQHVGDGEETRSGVARDGGADSNDQQAEFERLSHGSGQ